MRMKTVLGACMVAALGMMASAGAEKLSSADKAFLRSAAVDNMTEAHLGKMAQDQGSDAVKPLGQTLVKDHSNAFGELAALANKTGEKIPRGIDIRRNPTIEELTREKGESFDRRFVHFEVMDHQKTIAEFKREAERGQNPDVKAYAQKVLRTLEDHLHKAEELEKSEHQMTTASANRKGH